MRASRPSGKFSSAVAKSKSISKRSKSIGTVLGCKLNENSEISDSFQSSVLSRKTAFSIRCQIERLSLTGIRKTL